MAKTTVYIALAIGAQQPAYPAYVVFRAPYRFVSGKVVVLPEPDPVALAEDGTGVVSVDAGVWIVDEILPTQVFRRVVVVPESSSAVQYADLDEVTNPVDIGFGPSWAELAFRSSRDSAASAKAASEALDDTIEAKIQVQEIISRIPTESNALALALATAGPARTELLNAINFVVPGLVASSLANPDVTTIVTNAVAAAALSINSYKAASIKSVADSLLLPTGRNLFINPIAAGSEALVTEQNSNATIAAETAPGWPRIGSKSFKVANSGNAGYSAKNSAGSRPVPTAAGEAFAAAVTIHNPMSSSRQFYLRGQGETSASAPTGVVDSAVVTIPANTIARIFVTWTASATAAFSRFVVASAGAGGATTGDYFYVSEIDFYRGSVARPLIQGDQNTSYWEAAAHASASFGIIPTDVTVTDSKVAQQINAGPLSQAAVDARIAPVGKLAGIDVVRAAFDLTLSTNEYPNPDADGTATFVSDLSASCSISTDAFVGWPVSGTKSHKIANGGTGGYRAKFALADRSPASPGQVWFFRAPVFNPETTSRQVALSFASFYVGDASTERGVSALPAVTIPPGSSVIISGSYTVPTPPSGSTVVKVMPKLSSASSGGAAAGDRFYVDNIDWYTATKARDFHVSGNQANGYWTGAANASASRGVGAAAAASVKEGPLLFTDPRVGGAADASLNSPIDNTAALNRGYSMLDGVGGELFVPKGIYPFLTAPNAQPGGVWLTGEGFDYSTPSDPSVRPSRGSVFRALAAMTHLIHLGSGPALGPGQTGASIQMMSLDGNSLADSTLWANGSRNKIDKSQVYSGKLRAYLCAGQNVHATESVFAQESIGDVILVQGPTVLDNKVWTSQVRSPGPAGAAFRVGPGAVATDLQMCHLWAGGGGVPASAEALVVIEADGIAGNINTLITDNTIEGVLGPEIKINPKNGGTVSTTGIVGNKFYANDTMPDNVHPIIALAAGIHSTLTFTGNTATAPAANRRYKSLFDFADGVSSSGGFVVTGNVLRFVAAMFSGAVPPTFPAFGANQMHNGTSWKRTSNRGVALFTGDGTKTSFSITHGLVTTPAAAYADPGSPAAMAPHYTTWDGTDLVVTFATAPAAGDTIRLNWAADA